jgi:hypothetical protein
MSRRVKCKSGLEGWRARLRSNYNLREDWLRWSETYNLAERLGYTSADQAWDENPVIEGSVNPTDFRKVSK